MTAHPPITREHNSPRRSALRRLLLPLLICGLLPSTWQAVAQVNGVGRRPYLGWSTFSEQTINGNFLTQANIQAQSDALRACGLQSHGFQYINIDSGWQGSFDANGRPIPLESESVVPRIIDPIR